MDLLCPQGTSRNCIFDGPYKGPRWGPWFQGLRYGPRIGTKNWSPNIGHHFGPFIGTLSTATVWQIKDREIRTFILWWDLRLQAGQYNSVWDICVCMFMSVHLQCIVFRKSPTCVSVCVKENTFLNLVSSLQRRFITLKILKSVQYNMITKPSSWLFVLYSSSFPLS